MKVQSFHSGVYIGKPRSSLSRYSAADSSQLTFPSPLPSLPSLLPNLISPSLLSYPVFLPNLISPSLLSYPALLPNLISPSLLPYLAFLPNHISPSLLPYPAFLPNLISPSLLPYLAFLPNLISPSLLPYPAFLPNLISPSLLPYPAFLPNLISSSLLSYSALLPNHISPSLLSYPALLPYITSSSPRSQLPPPLHFPSLTFHQLIATLHDQTYQLHLIIPPCFNTLPLQPNSHPILITTTPSYLTFPISGYVRGLFWGGGALKCVKVQFVLKIISSATVRANRAICCPPP
ncbi:hypothetical protein Pcinc_039669 [Petrolisthes cinctipes]|uniref:Uncharacterized protein n=1 Tax=Petrolisthes cinctipes TaxID=88211 RepID=A0AAE1BN49_PETCI|nr:hypothetical protein Pcinc_039669 [Petrolisthes cinctipes]